MATTIIDLPRDAEVKSIRFDKANNQVVVEHRFGSKQTSAPVAYLTCKGAGGMESKASLLLLGNNGRFRVDHHDVEKQMAFDMSPADYEKWKASHAKRLSGDEDSEESVEDAA